MWEWFFLKYNTEEAWGLLKTRLEDSVMLHVLKIRRRVNNKPIWLDKKKTQATVRRKFRLYKRLKETIPQQQKKTRRNRRNKQFNSYIRIKIKYRSTIGPLIDRWQGAELLNDIFAGVFIIDRPAQVPLVEKNRDELIKDVVITKEDIVKKLKSWTHPLLQVLRTRASHVPIFFKSFPTRVSKF